MSKPEKTNTVSFIDEGMSQGGKNTILRKNTDHPGKPFAFASAPTRTQFSKSPDSKLLSDGKATLSSGLKFFSDATLNQFSGKLIKSS